MKALGPLIPEDDEFEFSTIGTKRTVQHKKRNRKFSNNDQALLQNSKRNQKNDKPNFNSGKSVKPYRRNHHNKNTYSGVLPDNLVQETLTEYSDFSCHEESSFLSNTKEQIDQWKKGQLQGDQIYQLNLQIGEEDGLLTSYLRNKEGKKMMNMI
jgi:hypothetical protein